MKMNRLMAFLVALLFVAGHGVAADKHFVWKVESASTHVYLVGSLHIADASMYPLPEPFQEAYKSTKKLAVEADITAMTPQDVLWMNEVSNRTDGKTLDDVLPADLLKQVKGTITSVGMPWAQVSAKKAWYVMILVTQLELAKAGHVATHGIDLHFLQRAKKDARPIIELESFRDQITMLDKSLSGKDEDTLSYTMHDTEDMKAEFEKLRKVWLEGDVDGMAAVFRDMDIEDEKERAIVDRFLKIILDDRNEKMAAKVVEMLGADVPIMVVVGAGHLAGKNSIVDILEKSGKYRIRQL